MNDLRGQLEQMLKMGGMEGLMGMMPGMGKMKSQMADAGFDDRMLRRQIALIQSMTKKERANPDLLQASRKKRIAAGAGLDVAELNRLLKMQRQMADVMKKMGKGGMMKQALRQMMGKGPSAEDMAAAQAELAKGGMPKLPAGGLGGFPGMGGGGLKLPPGLSGFGRKK
jgi:signal recognition particle subunit SRP54